MNSQLRNLALSAVLIAVPAGAFAVAEMFISPTVQATSPQAATTQGLGDLTAYKDIVRDTQKIASGGDLIAAERRIKDLEILWDDNAAALRKADQNAWNAIDAAADEVFSSLRSSTPDGAQVGAALASLQGALDSPVPLAATGPVQYVSGIAVTDETGRALPCEDLIGQVKTALAGKTPSVAVAGLQTKALERCNADDDANADAFSAQALSLIQG